MSAEVFDVAIFAALCGRDLNAAALRVQKFKPLIAPLRLEISITKRATTIRPDWSAAGPPPAGLELVELLFWVRLVRLATRNHVVPISVVGPESEANAVCSEYLGVSYSTGSDRDRRGSGEAGREHANASAATSSRRHKLSVGSGFDQGASRPSLSRNRRHPGRADLVPAGLRRANAVRTSLCRRDRNEPPSTPNRPTLTEPEPTETAAGLWQPPARGLSG